MNTKLLFSIIAIAFVGGLFSVAYAGDPMPTITLADNVDILGILDMNGNKITNVGTPTASTDLVTKEYADQGTPTDTMGLLSCSTNQVPKWSGTQWECSGL